MAGKEKYVVKEHKDKKTGETIKKSYRIDPGFVPTSVDEICIEFIENYLEANDKLAWGDEVASRTETVHYKTGKKAGTTEEKPISSMTFKKLFVEEFFPGIIKGTAEKKPTFRDRIKAKAAADK